MCVRESRSWKCGIMSGCVDIVDYHDKSGGGKLAASEVREYSVFMIFHRLTGTLLGIYLYLYWLINPC